MNILTLALMLMPAAVRAANFQEVNNFVQTQLVPFLGERAGHADIKVEKAIDGEMVVRINSQNSGRYFIRFRGVMADHRDGAPGLTLKNNRPLGGMILGEDWAINRDAVEDRLRGLFRADANLHPMIRAPGAPHAPSAIQEDGLAQLDQQALVARRENRAQRSLIWYPAGKGKTILSALFAKKIAAREETLVIYVVQSTDVLASGEEKFASVLKLRPHQIRRAYDVGGAKTLYEPGTKFIATTRSGLDARLDEFLPRADKFQGRIVWVFDEAQHVAKADGQFKRALTKIESRIRPRDVILGLSATPWHGDVGPIHSIFGKNLVTSFVSPAERQRLLETDNWLEMARLIFFRAIKAGYLSAIHSYRRIDYFGIGQETASRNFLVDSEKTVEAAAPTDRRSVFHRRLFIHEPFLRDVYREIRRTFAGQRGPDTYFNRGLMFVPSIAHAEAYARMLNGMFKPADRVEVRAYHSDDPKRAETMTWYKNADSIHKYLVVIDTIGEGFDHPGVNHLIFARPYGGHDASALKRLLQHLGRAARIGTNKTRLWISDYTGDLERLVFGNVDPVLVKEAFTDEGQASADQMIERIRKLTVKDDPDTMTYGHLVSSDSKTPVAMRAQVRPANERFTLARFLMEPGVMEHLYPGDKLHYAAVPSTIGTLICLSLTGRWDQTNIPGQPHLTNALLTGLGLHPDQLRASGRLGAVTQACDKTKNLFMWQWPATTRPDADTLEKELIALDPAVFGEKVNFWAVDLTGPRFYDREPIVPGANERSELEIIREWGRRWTLAELLLHPAVPMVLGLKQTDLIEILGKKPLPPNLKAELAEDWSNLKWIGRLPPDSGLRQRFRTAQFLFDRAARARRIEDLIRRDPEFFGRPTHWSDAGLARTLDRATISPTTRAKLDAYFYFKGLTRRAIPAGIKVPDARLSIYTDRDPALDCDLILTGA